MKVMKVMIVPFVIGALGTITTRIIKRPGGLGSWWMGRTIQMTALLRTARMLRRVLETWGDLLSLNLQWKNQLTLMWKILNNNNNNRNHHFYRIVEIGHNTEKSPGDLLSLRLQWKIISWRWWENLQGIIIIIIIIIIMMMIIYFSRVFHIRVCRWYFRWSLSDNKSPQVSRTLHSIQAYCNKAVVWMVLTRPLISKSSRNFYIPSVTLQKASITIGTKITLWTTVFFQFPRKVKEYVLIFIFFQFYSMVTRVIKVQNFASSLFFVDDNQPGLLAKIRWSVCMSKSHYYYYYFTTCKFLTPASTGGSFTIFWVTTSLQDFSQYSGRS